MPQDPVFGTNYSEEIEKLYQDSILKKLLQKTSYDSAKRSQLKDLVDNKEKLRKELSEAKIALAGCCENLDRLTEEYERLKKETEDLTKHDQIVSRRKTELQNELSLLMNTKSSTHDEEFAKKTKLEYKCVRNITQVRFSYDESNEDSLTGYVFNNATKQISSFSLNPSKLSQDQVNERLMKEMKKVSHSKYATVSSD